MDEELRQYLDQKFAELRECLAAIEERVFTLERKAHGAKPSAEE